MRPDVRDTTGRWGDYVFVVAERPFEVRLNSRREVLVSGVRQRLPTARLVFREDDTASERFEQLRAGNRRAGIELIDIAGNE
jgi:hypothetical protein